MSQKELDRLLEDALLNIVKMFGKIFKGIYWGVKKLNKKIPIIGLIISLLICFTGYLLKHKFTDIPAPIYIQYITYFTVLLFPLIYLFFLGNTHDRMQEKYNQIFKDIGFIGPDKKYPYLISKIAEGKKVTYIFKSLIPLADWKKNINVLETGLDCNIIVLQEGKNKKLAELTTVPSDCKIPEMINWSDEYIVEEESVFVLGEGALDKVEINMNKQPHIIIAGETGSGKSVILRVLIKQFIKKAAIIYMLDFKGGVEFGIQYENYGEVITERDRAITVLTELVDENNRRLKLFRENRSKNLGQYNKKTGENLQRIGVFADEVGELFDKRGGSKAVKEQVEILEGLVSTLARLARATGINLFLGIQRPDATVLTGQIKTNIPARVSGRFVDKQASEIVLGNTMAVDLPDIKGRFLYRLGNEIIPFQAYYFDDDTMLDEEGVTEEPVKKDITKKSRSAVNNKRKSVPRKEKNTSNNQTIQKVVEVTDPSIFDEKITWSYDEKVKELKDKDAQKEEEEETLNLDFDYSDYDFNYSEESTEDRG